MKKWKKNNDITVNRKAYHDYEIVKQYEAWIELKWHEVKSITTWWVNLKWSYIIFKKDEVFLKWMHVSTLRSLENKADYDPVWLRKVFIHKKEIISLQKKIQDKWLSIVPLKLFRRRWLIKLDIALVKWRKEYEKKQHIKEREIDRENKKFLNKY